ncbi:MAG: AP2/ERF family transcription factor [Luteolibacter sp.]
MKGFPGLYRETSKNGSSRFRILINHNKEITQEYFYFGVKVTESAARKAAKERWKEIRSVYPVLTKRKFREVLRKPTASGIAGVNKITTYSNGYEYEVWKATWTNRRGRRISKQFSINKYGTREAKRLAIEARMEGLDKIGAQ